MTDAGESTQFEVLDRAQLSRIEGIHHGFLYQHLFTVGCLLLAAEAGVVSVSPERDEDIELTLSDGRVIYCQVKTRTSPLSVSDVDGILKKFNKVRIAHSGARKGSPFEFWIISNSAPSAICEKGIRADSWPADVRVSWPESSLQSKPSYLPPTWRNATEAIRWCAELAETIPCAKLAGETLTLKLAAQVQYACSGRSQNRDHKFRVCDLPDMFEQVVVQFQKFPPGPARYRELETTPSATSEKRVRLILGLSGSGKTAWAAEYGRHAAEQITYFDVAELPSEALAQSLTREIAAQCIKGQGLSSSVLAPGLFGLDWLRRLDSVLASQGCSVAVVMDNAHRQAPETLASVVIAARSIRWILLAQPSQSASELASILQITAETVGSLTLDSIAAELRANGVAVHPAVAQRIRAITGGLPLFVCQAAALINRTYGGDPTAMCDELERGTHSVPTDQEHILAKSLSALSVPARRAAVALSWSEVPLTSEEARSLIAAAFEIAPELAATYLRQLHTLGIVTSRSSPATADLSSTPLIFMHDGFRFAAGALASEFPTETVVRGLRRLKDIIISSLKVRPEFDRQVFLLRLLPRTGDTKTLIDLATSSEELFAEYGFTSIVRPFLLAATEDPSLSPLDRFWAMDTIVFWDFQEGILDSLPKRLELLENFYMACGEEDPAMLGALLIKQILWAGKCNDLVSARRAFERAKSIINISPKTMRILRYDFACAMILGRDFQGAQTEAESLVNEYYEVMGLTRDDVLGANPSDIEAKIRLKADRLITTRQTGEDEDKFDPQDDLKRLGDTLELLALSLNQQGKRDPFARIHAHKFYNMSGAFTSMVRVGQDFVDELLSYNDFQGALEFLETSVLPVVNNYRLLNYLVPVRAQRAVVLAYLGREREAIKEIDQLNAFTSENSQAMQELRNQRELIQRILRDRVSRVSGPQTWKQQTIPASIRGSSKTRVGRNDPCPCGSGEKYKRCCGS